MKIRVRESRARLRETYIAIYKQRKRQRINKVKDVINGETKRKLIVSKLRQFNGTQVQGDERTNLARVRTISNKVILLER